MKYQVHTVWVYSLSSSGRRASPKHDACPARLPCAVRLAFAVQHHRAARAATVRILATRCLGPFWGGVTSKVRGGGKMLLQDILGLFSLCSSLMTMDGWPRTLPPKKVPKGKRLRDLNRVHKTALLRRTESDSSIIQMCAVYNTPCHSSPQPTTCRRRRNLGCTYIP